MKKIYKLLLFACILFLPFQSFAFEGGKVVLSPDVRADEAEDKTFSDLFNEYFSKIRYIDKEFPEENLDDVDIELRLRRLYPELDEKSAETQASVIRTSLKLWRFGKGLYDKYKESLLTPPEPAVIVDDKDYDTGEVPAYQPSDKPIIIQDFKKVINYGGNSRDMKAVAAHVKKEMAEETGDKSWLADFDIKKMLFYGILYDGPLDSGKGVGAWDGQSPLRVQLIATQSALGGQEEINAALHFDVEDGYMFAEQYEDKKTPIAVDFSASENLAAVDVLWPVPLRFINYKKNTDLVGYTGNFAVPLHIKVKDVAKPLKLVADIKLTVCGKEECSAQEVKPTLKLAAGKGYPTPMANFINMANAYLPQAENRNLEVLAAVIDNVDMQDAAQELRIVLKAGKTPVNTEVFVSDAQNTVFGRPRVSIDGSYIVARFPVVDKKTDLQGRSFVITAILNGETSLRTTVKAETSSLFDTRATQLTLGILFLGFIGGFLLNLMPCVFPVLSLKLLSFTKFGGMRLDNIKIGFAFHVLGIAVAFVILTTALLIIKALGYAIGWGMQFQSVSFLTFILFALTLFLAQILELININAPQFVGKVIYSKPHQDKLLHFLTGLFLVLLATPCTAPYLGTAVGFALAGSYLDIIAVMGAVGLGLASPYILVALFPSLAYYVPPPGSWMKKLYRLMNILLLVTIIWLLSVLYAQTSMALSLRFAGYLLLLLLILWFRKVLLNTADTQNLAPEILPKVKRVFNIATLVLILALFAGALVDARRQYHVKQAEVQAAKLNAMFDVGRIKETLGQGRIVLVRIGADWCLTCKFNDVTVFGNEFINDLIAEKQIEVIDVDWTNYNREILDFMGRFGRRGLPFYIIFTPQIPDGMVLPEILNEQDFNRLLNTIR